MILIKFLFFVAAAAVMSGVGIFLMIPPIRRGDREGLLTRMIIGFIAKLVLGVGFLLLCWKVFAWAATVSAFGMVGAYIVALMVILMTATTAIKHMNAKQQQDSEQEGDG